MLRLAGILGALLLASLPVSAQFTSPPQQTVRDFTSFGGRCDGTTDDATAFSSAVSWLSAANNREVRLPAATCATSATVTLGDGRQRSTTLTSGIVTTATSLPVASITGVLSGDTCRVQNDDATNSSVTVNGTPSAGAIPVSAYGGAGAASGNVVVCGKVSSYQGGRFVGYGSGATSGECSGGCPVSAIKYTGTAATSTTLSAGAASAAVTLTVTSITGFNQGDAIGITLDDASVWWTQVTRTPTGSAIRIMDPLPSAAASGNAVKVGLPVAKVAGPIWSAGFERVMLDANSLASIGLEVASAYRGHFRDVMARGYTGIGHYLHSQAGYTGPTGAMADNEFTLYANGPQNTKTIGLFFSGFCDNNMKTGFSRNRFYGGSWQGGGNDASAASMRENFADNNTFDKPYAYAAGSGTSGAGLYRQAGHGSDCANNLGANTLTGAAFDNGVTDNIPSGGALSYDLFPGYVTIDGEPIPTGWEMGFTDTGVHFGGPYAAWTDFTPTLSCGSGTLTSAVGSGKYNRIGKTVRGWVRAVITTNGSCATVLNFTVPVAPQDSGLSTGTGRSNATGAALTCVVGTANIAMRFATNLYPGVDGATLQCSFEYEAD